MLIIENNKAFAANVSGRGAAVIDINVVSVGDDPFRLFFANPPIFVGSLSEETFDTEDEEWEEIDDLSLSSERIDAVADYLRRTGQASV